MTTNIPLDIEKTPATKTLANGAIYDLDKKRIVSGAVLSSDRARAMVQKRVEKYRRAMVERIMGEAVSIDPTVTTPADAFGLVAAKQYTTLMDSEKPRIADLEKLGQMMTGQIGAEPQRSHEPVAGQITTQASTLLELAALIEAEQARRLDRARAIDGEIIHDAE